MSRIDSLIGHTLSNYRIERLLGRGGMASVFYAVDTLLGRPAALKVIDLQHPDVSGYSDRFAREARAMASWRHPNIPHVYQAGVEDGFSFYAMEYIRGMDLGKLLSTFTARGELLPVGDILQSGRAVAAALDYAQQKGAIHRDVKPTNILVSEDGRILLTDFGLVLELEKGTFGEVFGSPLNIAPEQAQSSSRAVPQSDLYALGIVLIGPINSLSFIFMGRHVGNHGGNMRSWKKIVLILVVVLTILSLLLSACGPVEKQHGNTDRGSDQDKDRDKGKEKEKEKSKEDGAGKILICHLTGSAKKPYVQISVANDALKEGHGNHAGDLIPAPAGGCPKMPPTQYP